MHLVLSFDVNLMLDSGKVFWPSMHHVPVESSKILLVLGSSMHGFVFNPQKASYKKGIVTTHIVHQFTTPADAGRTIIVCSLLASIAGTPGHM